MFAHGPITVPFPMQDAASEVVGWANAHASELEDALVLLIVADCNGDACVAAAEAAFTAVGLPVVSGAGCTAASDFTVSTAMAAAALAGGGHAIALMNCPGAPVSTYDDRLSCTGFANVTAGEAFEADISACLALPSLSELLACVDVIAGVLDLSAHYACYDGPLGRDAALPFARLREFNVNVTALPPPAGAGERGLLVSIMGCWAQNVQSTELRGPRDSWAAWWGHLSVGAPPAMAIAPLAAAAAVLRALLPAPPRAPQGAVAAVVAALHAAAEFAPPDNGRVGREEVLPVLHFLSAMDCYRGACIDTDNVSIH